MNLDKAAAIRKGEELDMAKLNAFLKSTIDELGDVEQVSQFPGGFSNLTYLIKTSAKEYIIRRPPFGANAKGGHDMSREFRVLSLLHQAGYHKAPLPLCLEETGEVFGAPFYVMERLNGVILRAKDAQNLLLTEGVMQKLCERLLQNLAHLHSLNIEETGLIAIGKPEGYVHRQVSGWIHRYKSSQTDDVSDMERVAQWISHFQPREQKPTFIHNDYKFDNVVWQPNMTDIAGVLDWEMATVGDPLMDLGATLAYWCEYKDPDFVKMFNITWIKGCMKRAEVIEKYAALTGRDVTDILFYYVFGLYKNAVIIQQIYARWKKGLTHDARFANLLIGVKELSALAKKAIDTNSI